MSISNVKIRTKLILTFVFFVLLLIIRTGLSLRSLNNANNGVQLIIERIYPNTVAATDLIDNFNAFIDVQQQVLLDEDKRWTQDADKRMEEINVIVRGLLKKFNTELEDDASRKVMAQIMNHRIPYLESRDRVMEAIINNQRTAALEEMMGTTMKLQDEYQAMVHKLIDIQNQYMVDAGKQITVDYQSNRVLVLVIALLSILVALIVGFTLIRSITRPLNQAMVFASAIADGDLTASIDCERQDETGVLLRALMEMKTRLQVIVKDVQVSAMHISSAVEQIVAGNQDLAARTEEQASSVEETAASMEQITATVKNTYDNTHEATRLSSDASTVVKHNGEMMAQVTSKMRLINTASTRMSEIINLIDSIAFQTNILALNAAVEAARAGEHGRGFAVVAGEVRQLAQKSASSASEIRSLIESSVCEAQEGMALVESAASHIDGMVAHVDEINVILHEIAQASREQSDGIGQINRAIGLIDTATQQNSSLVEESVAAATSLNKQAHQLKNVVEVFRISDASV